MPDERSVAPARLPLDYQSALDVAVTFLAAQHSQVLVVCGSPALAAAAAERWPLTASPAAALWIEPDAAAWRPTLARLAAELPPSAPLVIICSQPLARLIPERAGWPGAPLGLRRAGEWRLRRALVAQGFTIIAEAGIHTVGAIAWNQLGQLCKRWGRPDLADRCEFAARLRYHTVGRRAALVTVGVIVVRRAGQ